MQEKLINELKAGDEITLKILLKDIEVDQIDWQVIVNVIEEENVSKCLKKALAIYLWDELRKIIFTEEGTIETPFIFFDKGTTRAALWDWFGETFDVSPFLDLMKRF